MLGLILRRLRDLAIVLVLVGTAIFFIVRVIPGDAALAVAGDQATPEQVEAIREAMGLNVPLWQQYVTWFGQLLVGDFGTSTSFHTPVAPIILSHLLPTVTLALAATVLSIAITVPLSIGVALYPRNWLWRTVNRFTAVGIAVPEFWLALLLVTVFAVTFGAVPVSGWVNPFVDPAAGIPHLILPIVVLMVGQISTFALMLRDNLIGEMLQPYLRTARAKGARERRVFYRHALPNALLPAVTVVGNNLGTLLGGIVVLETIFVIPGLGSLLFQAVSTRDYAIIQGATIVIAIIFVVLNFIVDLIYLLLDPRVRVS
ncbi:MAG TPA: ABC transporter permease [Microbacteriaceae bacterium]|nr:ABC transporter permease [Microbacteriaceae bacterium]